MSNAKQNRRQNDSAERPPAGANRKIEPPRMAPLTERGLTHSPYFNGPLYQRMSEDLHLGGMSKRTHEGYLRAVRQLADFCKLSPDQITEDLLRKFFLHLKNDKSFASGSLRVAFSGVKFFYTRTCRREWQTADDAMTGRHKLRSNVNFKTRIEPCRIAVRADHEKCEQFTKNRPRGSDLVTSSGDEQSQIPSLARPLLRVTYDCQLKTDDSQRSCELHFPYAACRCNTTGLLEQMP